MKISEDTLIEDCSKNLEFLRKTINLNELFIRLSKKFNVDFNLVELNELLYFNSLITISKLDLSIILKNLKLSEDKWENIYFMKSAFLTINETIDGYNSHRKKLFAITEKYPQFKIDFFKIEKGIKQFKKDFEFETKIKLIRNKTAGHIDKDFKLYYDELNKLKKSKSLKMIEKFIELNINYLELAANLLNS